MAAQGSPAEQPVSESWLKAVLWDMDGTLVDTEPHWIDAERALVEEFGGTWRHSQAIELVGQSLWHSAGILQQAGVALGMCNQAAALGGGTASIVRNVTLFSVLIYDMVGPLLTRDALQKAGEIAPTPEHKKDRKRVQTAQV